ncbi:hypothetical protein D041_4892A, partial [Vibrio parahaemolyticus EKP-008]
MVVYIERAG